MKTIILFITLLTFPISFFAQELLVNGWKQDNLKNSVKQLITDEYKYVERFGNLELEKVSSQKNLYNEDGQYISLKKESMKNGYILLNRIYTYKNGVITSIDDFDRENDVGEKRHYNFFYNDNGNLSKEELINLDYNSYDKYVITFEYNNNKIISYNNYDELGKLVRISKRKYDDNGNISELAVYDGHGNIECKFNYSYDLRNNKTNFTKTDYTKREINTINSIYYKYDSNDNIIQECRVYYCPYLGESRPDSHCYAEYVIEYNSSNQIKKLTVFSLSKKEYVFSDSERTFIESENYKYDVNGNWVEKETEEYISANMIKSTKLIKRTIQYY